MHVKLQGIYWSGNVSGSSFLQLLQVAACGRGQVVSCLRLHRRQQVNYALSLSSPRFAACGATSGSTDATSDAPKEIKNVAAAETQAAKNRKKNQARQGGTLIKRPKNRQ